MKYYRYSLYLSTFSFIILLVIFLLPGRYSIFLAGKTGLGAGKLFVVMWFIWLTSLLAFALNNIFADRWYLNENLHMSQFKKYLPSLLGLPALVSFIWVVYTWLKVNIKF